MFFIVEDDKNFALVSLTASNINIWFVFDKRVKGQMTDDR